MGNSDTITEVGGKVCARARARVCVCVCVCVWRGVGQREGGIYLIQYGAILCSYRGENSRPQHSHVGLT